MSERLCEERLFNFTFAFLLHAHLMCCLNFTHVCLMKLHLVVDVLASSMLMLLRSVCGHTHPNLKDQVQQARTRMNGSQSVLSVHQAHDLLQDDVCKSLKMSQAVCQGSKQHCC